jgi:hypothetical protein
LLSNNNNITYTIYKENTFWNNILSRSINNNDNNKGYLDTTRNNNNKIIYQFIGFDWQSIVLNFKVRNISISGGSNTFKHIISPTNLNLSLFLFSYFEDFHTQVNNSFKLANAKEFARPKINLNLKKNQDLINSAKEILQKTIEQEIEQEIEEESNTTPIL